MRGAKPISEPSDAPGFIPDNGAWPKALSAATHNP